MSANFGEMFYKRLPELYRTEDVNPNLSPATPLHNFLRVMGAGFDEMHDYINDFENIYDIDQCPAELLDFLLAEAGLPITHDATEKEKRIILRDLPYLIRNKGSKDVLEFIARTFVGDVYVEAERRVIAPTNYIDITLYYSTTIENITAKLDRLTRYIEHFRPLNHYITFSALPDSFFKYTVARKATYSYVDNLIDSYIVSAIDSSLMDEGAILGGKRLLGTGFRLGYYPHIDILT